MDGKMEVDTIGLSSEDNGKMVAGYRKRLEEMSLEELWELFPVELVPHRREWTNWAAEEIKLLGGLLAEASPVIHHIGSTAIPSICAKPTVDILVELSPGVCWQRIRTLMEAAGYICMSASAARMSFNKGYTPEGYADKVFHIHFRHPGDNDEILFRDYLLYHPAEAKAYEALKLSLLPAYRHDRDAYTAAKTPFVRRILSLARQSGKSSNEYNT